MNLQQAFALFRRLGVDPEYLSLQEFRSAYFTLAKRYHPDRNPLSGELMANINIARIVVLDLHFAVMNGQSPHRGQEFRPAAP